MSPIAVVARDVIEDCVRHACRRETSLARRSVTSSPCLGCNEALSVGTVDRNSYGKLEASEHGGNPIGDGLAVPEVQFPMNESTEMVVAAACAATRSRKSTIDMMSNTKVAIAMQFLLSQAREAARRSVTLGGAKASRADQRARRMKHKSVRIAWSKFRSNWSITRLRPFLAVLAYSISADSNQDFGGLNPSASEGEDPPLSLEAAERVRLVRNLSLKSIKP